MNLATASNQETSMEDLIDFRCSDDWRDFYAAKGMTYPSGRTRPQYDFDSPEFQRTLRVAVKEALAHGVVPPAPPPQRPKKVRGLPRR